MTWLYVSSFIITTALMAYLSIALLKPEWFE